MSAEQGVYVELLPEGKIKKDLAGILDEVSFAEAKISDEIFLFSELIFEPYAAVVDLIRSQARAILMYDDHGGLANMTLFQFMLDTVDDLVSTLEQENPLHGTLLRAQLEDEVPPDDGTAMYPFRASKKILTILVGVMQFQFVVNEVLHDIQTGESLISDKYDTLWEVPMRSILRWDGDGLTTQYHFRSAVDYYHFLLLQFVSGHPAVAWCHCCGRYFIPKTKKKTLYCDRILKDGKTCKEWGPVLKHRQKAAQISVVEEFDRTKRRMYKRYERAEFLNKESSEKDLSYEEYYQWLDRAVRARDDYLAGKLPAEEALKTIQTP